MGCCAMPFYHPVIPTAEPFLFKGDQIGIVLVHGFTGAPKEMRDMGEYYAAQGHTVLGIRLPGHATHPQDLPRMRWTDWLHAVEDGYHLLHSAGCHVFIMGLSLGGCLTLTAAARLPVAGAVAMSTPHHLPSDPRLPLAQYLAWAMPTVPKGPSDWQDLSMAQEHVEYPAFPTRGIAELRDLIEEMRRSLPQIRCPVLLAQARADGSVLPENVEHIYAELGTSDKSIFWLEKSGHVVTRDLERQRLFEAAENFLRRIAAA
jgi:carboxylesterase